MRNGISILALTAAVLSLPTVASASPQRWEGMRARAEARREVREAVRAATPARVHAGEELRRSLSRNRLVLRDRIRREMRDLRERLRERRRELRERYRRW